MKSQNTVQTIEMIPRTNPAWAIPPPLWVPPEAAISFLAMLPRIRAGMPATRPQHTRPAMPRMSDHSAFWLPTGAATAAAPPGEYDGGGGGGEAEGGGGGGGGGAAGGGGGVAGGCSLIVVLPSYQAK